MLLEGNIDGTLDLLEQLMNVSEYTTMKLARILPPFRLLFPELYEHPRYQEMLRKHDLDDKSVAELKVLPHPF